MQIGHDHRNDRSRSPEYASSAELFKDVGEAIESLEKAISRKEELTAANNNSPTDAEKFEIKALEKTIEALSQRVATGNASIASGRTTTQVGTSVTSQPPPNDAIQAAKEISMHLIGVEDTGYLCFRLFEGLSARAPSSGPTKELYDYCNKYFDSSDTDQNGGGTTGFPARVIQRPP